MKRRYLLPSAALTALGLCAWAFLVYYGFAGLLLLCLGAAVFAFGAVDALKNRFPRAMRLIRRVLLTLTALFAAASIATGVYVGIACGGADDPQADYLIVLGAGVNGTEPSRSLNERLRAAEAYLRTYPDAVAVLSGGQGDFENISEAECMYRRLVDAGIPAERLRKEERATSTEENLAFSLALIEAECEDAPETVAVVSSEYHLCRAALLAERAGVRALPVPARTENRVYFVQMFAREIFGIWYTLLT